jgi:hypothetical protein
MKHSVIDFEEYKRKCRARNFTRRKSALRKNPKAEITENVKEFHPRLIRGFETLKGIRQRNSRYTDEITAWQTICTPIPINRPQSVRGEDHEMPA